VRPGRDRSAWRRLALGDVVAGALALLAPALVAVEAPVLLRAPVVAALLLLGPGLVVVGRLDLPGGTAAVVVPGISLAFVAVVSMAVVYAGWWSALHGVAVVSVLTLAGVLLVAVRGSKPAAGLDEAAPGTDGAGR
jgi:hypothetical protein